MTQEEFVARCRDIRDGSPNAFYALVDAYCKQVEDADPRDYHLATAEERAMARGFVTLWQSVGVQDAEDWLYALRNRAELLASLDEDDSREAQDNTPSLGPYA